ncbi:DUF5665 domain-containing protein [Ruegeria jejuensis]|uniref:DUF5665 domain-containing protein n=1 Tax=Ruegeria jejuensis TaxID=3233338 RepID=UPI00355C3BE4
MTDGVEQELRALREEIERFNGHRFVQVQNSLGRMLFQALLRGMAVGLGTVIGASILVSVLVYILSQIDFVPVIGDWAKEIAEEIKVPNGESASDTQAGASGAD